MDIQYGSKTVIKRNFKNYVLSLGKQINLGKYPLLLAQSCVIILNDIFVHIVENVSKSNVGLYQLNLITLVSILSKYNNFESYYKVYNSTIDHSNTLMMDTNSVFTQLEKLYGNKIFLDYSLKNLIMYYVSCVQYDVIRLTLNVLEYQDKKTLNDKILLMAIEFVVRNTDLYSQIQLKLDSNTEPDVESATETDTN